MSTDLVEATQADPASPKRGVHLGEFGWVWVGLLVLYLLSGIVAPGTLQLDTFRAILPFTAALAIAAVGQTLVIQQRGLDFSVPGTITIVAVVTTKVGTDKGSMIAGLVAGLGVAALIGLANALLVARLSITPLVATLAMNAVLIGASFSISGGAYTTAPDGWASFSKAKPLGIPTAVVIAVVLIATLAFLQRKSVVGRRFVLVGANPGAARAAGISVESYQLSAYVTCSVCAGLAGALLAGFVGAATPDLGSTYLLSTIVAVVVGGTPFTGGRGSLIATAAGALFLSQLGQLTLAMGTPASVQLFVQAAVLVLAASLRHIRFGLLLRLVTGGGGAPGTRAPSSPRD